MEIDANNSATRGAIPNKRKTLLGKINSINQFYSLFKLHPFWNEMLMLDIYVLREILTFEKKEQLLK